MKKLLSLVFIAQALTACTVFSQETKSKNAKDIVPVYVAEYKYNQYATSKITDYFIFDECKDIYTNPTRYDLGNIFMDTKYDFYPKLVNNSDMEIPVTSMRGTCSCTSVKATTGLVKPKSDITIGIEYNSTGFPNGKKIRKSVYAYSDAITPKGKTRTFYENIVGFDNSSVVPETKLIQFEKGGKSALFVLENVSDNVIKDFKLYSTDNSIEFTTMELDKKSKYTIEIKSTGVQKPGYQTTATFYGEGDSLCVFSVPVLFK